LTSLHVGSNEIPEKEMREIMAIAMGMGSMKILCEVPFKDKRLTELDVSGKNLGREGALVVAEYLDGNGVLSKLDASDNDMFGDINKAGVTAWADALKGNTSLPEPSLATPDLGGGGAQILADAISDTEALSTFTFSGEYSSNEPVTMDTTMTEADFSGKELGVSGGMMVAAFLPKCR
jgi:hypothetical protein